MSDPVSGHITLLTDFGERDGYVGVMKGVIAGIHPDAKVIDISHEIPPQDIRSAAFLIERSFGYFPRGTVHVVVVDPGVGSKRKGLVLHSQGHYFVGPDNGVFSGVLEGAEVRSLTETKYWLVTVSSTFHGRDIFAPVAAHLAKGIPIAEMGPLDSDPVSVKPSGPRRIDKGWSGDIVYADRFGNLITNLGPEEVASFQGHAVVATHEDGSKWPLVKTYSDVPKGARCALLGGFGLLELCINQGDAETGAELEVGSSVHLLQAD